MPISIRFATNRPEIFNEAIAARLAEVLGQQLEPAHTDPATYYEDRCRLLLAEAAERKKQILLVIDGIDEALGDRFDASWFPKSPSPGIRLLVSARWQVGDRDWQGWAGRLSWGPEVRLQTLDLPCLGVSGVRDLLLHAGAPVDALATQLHIVEKLYDLSEGEPLLVKLYVQDLWKREPDINQLTPEDLDHIQPGFHGYFQDWVNRHPDLWQDDTPVLRYLAVLACAYGPLTVEDLSDLTWRTYGIRPGLRVENALRPARRFIIGTGEQSLDDNAGYVLTHPKFGEFLREYFDRDQIEHVQQSFVAWGRDTVAQLKSAELPIQECPLYLLYYLTQHFIDVKATVADYMSLVEDGWRLAWHWADKHYSGYAGDIRRIDTEAKSSRDIRLETRCALALGSVTSLSEAVPIPILILALEGDVITGSRAAELIRYVPDTWAKALSIIAVSRYANHELALRLLKIAEQISDVQSNLFAKAGLIDRVPPSTQEALASQVDTRLFYSSPLRELFAKRLINKEGFLRADEQLIERLDDVFRSWIYGSDMSMFSQRLGEIIPILYPADQATFARMAVRATQHRSWRYDEDGWSQLLVNAIVDYSPIDVLPALIKLLRRSPEPSDASYVRLAARYAALGDPSHLKPALASLDPARAWAASYALHALGEKDRETWSAACVVEFESLAEWRKHIEAITVYLRFRPADERSRFASRLWSQVRQIPDTSERFSFAKEALLKISGNQRTALSDGIAKRILESGSPDLHWLAAEIGRHVSDTWLAPLRTFLGNDIKALLVLCPRLLGTDERDAVLQPILRRELLSEGPQSIPALAQCLESLDGTEQHHLATEILNRIAGEAEGWEKDRRASMLWAELIEGFAPALVRILGPPALKKMKSVAKRIASGPNRAIALAALAKCAQGAEAASLALAALAQDADTQREARTFIGLPDLLSQKQITAASQTVEGSVNPLRLLIEKIRSHEEWAKREPEGTASFRASIVNKDYQAAQRLWIEAVKDQKRDVLERLVADLTSLTANDRDVAKSFWSEGLDARCLLGRPSVIVYLRSSLPLLAAIAAEQDLAALVNDVFDICSWEWR